MERANVSARGYWENAPPVDDWPPDDVVNCQAAESWGAFRVFVEDATGIDIGAWKAKPKTKRPKPTDPDLLPLAAVAAAVGLSERQTKEEFRRLGLSIGGTRTQPL